MRTTIALAAIGLAALSGCSGGNGGESHGTKEPGSRSTAELFNLLNVDRRWYELISRPATEITEQELQTAYWGLAVDEYRGRLEPAEISAEAIDRFSELHDTEGWFTLINKTLGDLGVEAYDAANYDPASQSRVVLNDVKKCRAGGTVTVQGELKNGAGVVNVDYLNCYEAIDTLTGQSVAKGEPIRWEPFEVNEFSTRIDYPMRFDGTQAFSDFEVENGFPDPGSDTDTTPPFVYHGYKSSRKEELDEQGALITRRDALGFTGSGGEHFLFWYETTELLRGGYLRPVEAEGLLSIESLGSVAVQYEAFALPAVYGGLREDPDLHKHTFTGAQNTSFSLTRHICDYVLLAVDSDGDGSDDLGRYLYVPFADRESHRELIPIEELNHPPVLVDSDESYISRTENNDFFAEISSVYYDPDTPTELLQLEYHWGINGVDVDTSGPLLAADQLSEEDFVTLFITISDGINTVRTEETSRDYIY